MISIPLPVTLWYSYSSYNHFEFGWQQNDKPLPFTELHTKVWSHTNWKKQYAFLVEGKICKLENIQEIG